MSRSIWAGCSERCAVDFARHVVGHPPVQADKQVRRGALEGDFFQYRPFLPGLHCQRDFAHEVRHQYVFGRVGVVVVAAAEGRTAHVFALAGGQDVEQALLDVGGVFDGVFQAACGGNLPVAGAGVHGGSLICGHNKALRV